MSRIPPPSSIADAPEKTARCLRLSTSSLAACPTRARGHVTDADLSAVRHAGYSDAQVIKIVQHVSLNTWTNYVNVVFGTDIDFPIVQANKAA